jgi:Conserved region of Rad21 / Rec8 like protein
LLDLEGSAERRRLSSLSLGLVNDFVNEFEQEDDDDDEEEVDPRQGQGDELVSSSSKWHKHTVKVFDMLRRNMPDDGPRQMSFNAICDPGAVTRRTACGVFFELLQLKTWDYIELDQDEFFGDMKVRQSGLLTFAIFHPLALLSLCPLSFFVTFSDLAWCQVQREPSRSRSRVHGRAFGSRSCRRCFSLKNDVADRGWVGVVATQSV